MSKRIVSVEHLAKSFKNKQVLHDISFEIFQGDCIALIGPNGSGKTTLFNCLIGDYKLNGGRVAVMERSPRDEVLKQHVGVLFQANVTEAKLRVSELLDFRRAIYDNPLSMAEIDALLQFSDAQKKQFAEKLSGGQRRLLAFVQVLIGRPDILVLDEPTAGMDTSTRKRFWEIVNALKAAGTTIIYSSHYIEEVEHTADRILVLHNGRLVRDTTPYLMRTEDTEKVFVLPAKYLEAVRTQPINDLVVKSDIVQFNTKAPQRIWDALVSAGCPIDDIEMTNRTLLTSIFDSVEEGEQHENI